VNSSDGETNISTLSVRMRMKVRSSLELMSLICSCKKGMARDQNIRSFGFHQKGEGEIKLSCDREMHFISKILRGEVKSDGFIF
jgi:hypothetical protein